MSDSSYLNKLIAQLNEEQRENLWLELGKQLTDLPAKQQSKIEIGYMSELSDEIHEFHKNFGKFQGLTSGYRKIDQQLTKGFLKGEMTVLAGHTSNGKSAMAINMAERLARQHHKVMFVTLEMTILELGSRFEQVHGKQVKDIEIMYQKNDELDWHDVDGLIENAVGKGAEIVFIDHLHYFVRDTEHQNESLAMISKEIKKNAIRHNIPIVLLAQTRKGAKDKQEYGIDDIMGSGAIVQDADIVLFVRRDKEDPDILTMQGAKNRNRGIDYRDGADIVTFDFRSTIITDPEFDTVIDQQTAEAIYVPPFGDKD